MTVPSHSNGTSASNRNGDIIHELSAVVSKLIAICEINDRQLQDISAELHKVLVPLAEENRSFKEKDADQHITLPFARDLIAMLNRHAAEVENLDQGRLVLSDVERCRALDRVEILNMLNRRGIEPIATLRGSHPDPRYHDVFRVKPTHDTSKHSRISRVLRAGFWRRDDGLLIQPAIVEVWGPAIAAV